MQTYTDIEVLLIDDGSTDSSGSICDSFAEQDARIKVFHKDNGGLSDARNFGLDKATGDYVAFVDGDDYIHHQMFQIMIRLLEETGCNMSVCKFERIDEKDSVEEIDYDVDYLDYYTLENKDAMQDLTLVEVIACNKVYKRDIFENIRYPKGRFHEDEYVIYSLLLQCEKLVVVDLKLYFYIMRSDSITHRMSEKRMRDAMDGIFEGLKICNGIVNESIIDSIVTRYCSYCIDCYEKIRNGIYNEVGVQSVRELQAGVREISKIKKDIKIEYKLFATNLGGYNLLVPLIDGCRRIKRKLSRFINR
jgi:glycosyltransferase involved in cell wall biosynthesis